MFFKRNKRRIAKTTSVDAACTSVESLDPIVLMSASNSDGGAMADGAANNSANGTLTPVNIEVEDGVIEIYGTGLNDIVDVYQFEGSLTVLVLAVTKDGNGNEVSTYRSVFRDSVERIEFYGKSGNDIFRNRTDVPSYASGGFGNDRLVGGTGEDELRGDFGDDVLIGDYDEVPTIGGSDILHGGPGDDTLRGGAKADELYGDSGSDHLWGDGGKDLLYGDHPVRGRFNLFAGDDVLHGGADNDILYGMAGNDFLHGEDHADQLYGGAGDDNLFGDINDPSVTGGRDFLYGGTGNDNLWGGFVSDFLDGGSGDDLLAGGDAGDQLFGGQGADRLFGGDGNDYMDPGFDNDVDVLNGGAGRDTFVLHRRRHGFPVFDIWEDLDDLDKFFIRWHW